ncbi:MAG: hypothetical protein Q7J79_03810 [Gemmatimonadales bacterium]|nr:hypothetical protein [Gemmatimonadales bacterium]
MTAGRAFALAAWSVLAAAALPRAAAAQFFPAQPAGYLLTTDASDGRALWVNPAGLVRRVEASVGVDVAIERSPAESRLAQFGVLAAARNLAFGWSHNRLPAGASAGGNLPERTANVFTVGLGLGDSVFSAGAAKRWYRGDARASAWDVAARVAMSRRLDASVVWRDIGSPIVADTVLEETLVPAVALSFFRGRLRVGAEWHVATGGWSAREVRTGWTIRTGERLAVMFRNDLTPGLGRRRTVLAVQWGLNRARATLSASGRGATDTETYGAGLLLISAPPPARGRPGR